MTKPRRTTYLPARALALFGAMGTTLMFTAVACGGDDTPVVPVTKKGGNAGKAGANAGGASAANGGSSAANGGTGTGASAGSIPFGGSGGATGGSSAANGGNAGSGTAASGGANGGNGTGAAGNNGVGGECSFQEPPKPTITRHCRPPTDNECDNVAFDQVGLHKPEGPSGNGFDDDCDGKVDEGCACELNSTLGSTKNCYLLPSSQTTGPNGTPPWGVQGACAVSSVGKLTCIKTGSGEFATLTYGGGNCQGALPGGDPKQEICSKGDFDCNGVDADPAGGCKCKDEPIVCPGPLFGRPFPDPNQVGQLSKVQNGTLDVAGVDVKRWITPTVADPSSATNIRWTVTGGPCDDILPHPTFAAFPTPVSAWAQKLGTENNKLPLVPAEKQPAPDFPAGLKQGWVINNNAPSLIYPAFSLSGDYYLTAKFQYKKLGETTLTDAECTQVVKVRAPGLRVEMCWPEVGFVTSGGAAVPNSNDVDLHVARLQGNTVADGKHGWFTPKAGDQQLKYPQVDDCYWSSRSGCGNRIDDTTLGPQAFKGSTPGWFPADKEVTPEPGGQGVCHGWGSRRFKDRQCTSPRLDRDNIVCDPAIDDPNSAEKDPGQKGENTQNFCGPENINIDGQALTKGDRFAIGVQCYGCVSGSGAGRIPAHPRVNIYCDGELKKGIGYDPEIPKLADQFPVLTSEGEKYAGSMWNVGVVTWNNDSTNPCTIETSVPAGGKEAFKASDAWHKEANGSEFQCVMNGARNSRGQAYDDTNAAPTYSSTEDWRFNNAGTYPATAQALCPY